MAITKATASSIAPAAKGDLVVGSGTNDAAVLAVGTNDYVLTAASGETTGLKWAAPAAGGKVLQVVQGTLTANFSTASASYVDVGLSVSITPSSATSKIFVAVSAPNAYTVNGASSIHNYSIFNLVRTSTQLVDAVIGNYNYASSNDPEFYCSVNITYLDSPATTSATTYKVQAKKGSSTAAKIDASGTRIHSIVVMEIGA